MGFPRMRCPFAQTWIRLPHNSWRGITKKDTSEKLKSEVVLGGAVAEGTIAPSGTWWTTLGPRAINVNVTGSTLEQQQVSNGILTLLGVEFAVKYGADHDVLKCAATRWRSSRSIRLHLGERMDSCRKNGQVCRLATQTRSGVITMRNC